MKVQLSVGRTSALFAMGRVLNGRIGSALKSYKWQLLDAPNGLSLPLSDNPFCAFAVKPDGVVEYGHKIGVGLPGAHFMMPVTPTKLLHACVGRELPSGALEESSEFWDIVFKVIVQSAGRYIYSREIDSRIESMRPSVVDPDYLKEYDEAVLLWGQS